MRGAAPLRDSGLVSSDDGGQPGGCVRSKYCSRHRDTAINRREFKRMIQVCVRPR